MWLSTRGRRDQTLTNADGTGIMRIFTAGIMWMMLNANAPASGAESIPSVVGIKRDRPRLLPRSSNTSRAISWSQRKSSPRDPDFQQMPRQLENLAPLRAAALALAFHLTGQPALAERAIELMRAWQMPREPEAGNDPFRAGFTLLEHDPQFSTASRLTAYGIRFENPAGMPFSLNRNGQTPIRNPT